MTWKRFYQSYKLNYKAIPYPLTCACRSFLARRRVSPSHSQTGQVKRLSPEKVGYVLGKFPGNYE